MSLFNLVLKAIFYACKFSQTDALVNLAFFTMNIHHKTHLLQLSL